MDVRGPAHARSTYVRLVTDVRLTSMINTVVAILKCSSHALHVFTDLPKTWRKDTQRTVFRVI